MVRMRGLEPPRCHHHRLLRPARLPVPPHPRMETHYTNRASMVSRNAVASIAARRSNNLSLLVSTPVTPISPIHIRVSPISEVASLPIVVCAVTITVADAVATVHKQTISSKVISPGPATVPTTITRVMAVHKLCAFLIQIGSTSPSSTSPLGQ